MCQIIGQEKEQKKSWTRKKVLLQFFRQKKNGSGHTCAEPKLVYYKIANRSMVSSTQKNSSSLLFHPLTHLSPHLARCV